MKNPLKQLNRFEWGLWLGSLAVILCSFFFLKDGDLLSLIASLIGATALIFVSKGMVLGQVLTVVFAVFYGIISFHFRYYGEMITYLCMTAPIAVMAVISWLRHPYRDSAEVKVGEVTARTVTVMLLLAAAVTTAFYFILGALGTANLVVSTVSVTTSFIASYLTFLRHPFYAFAYALNDIVLIILWVLATVEDISYLPMIACFVVFLVNDLYGLFNWQRMRRRQNEEQE